MINIEEYYSRLEQLSVLYNDAEVETYMLHQLELIDAPAGSCDLLSPICKTAEDKMEQELAEKQGRLNLQAIVGNDLMSFYRDRGQWEKCLGVIDRLLKNIKEADMEDTALHGNFLLNRACILMQTGDIDGTIEFAKKAEEKFSKADEAELDVDGQIALYSVLANVYKAKGDNDAFAAAVTKAREWMAKKG